MATDMHKQSLCDFRLSKDKYGNSYIQFKKSHKKMQFQSSSQMVESSKVLILVKILITKGYGQKYVKEFLEKTSSKLQISSKQFQVLNKNIIKTLIDKIQVFVESYCNIKSMTLIGKSFRKLCLPLLRYQQSFDIGFQQTLINFFKIAYNLDSVTIYVDEAKALFLKILNLADKNEKELQHCKAIKSQNKKSKSHKLKKNKQSQGKSFTFTQDSSQSGFESSTNSNALQKIDEKKIQQKKEESSPRLQKIKKGSALFPPKYRKILTITNSKLDNERTFVARVLIQKGMGTFLKMNEYIHENKLKRQEYPEMYLFFINRHQNDYKKIFYNVTMRICRYLEFILGEKNRQQVQEFGYDELKNLERVFTNYQVYFIERQKELFQNLVKMTFELPGKLSIDRSQYWPLYIQLNSLSVKQIPEQIPQMQASVIILPKVIVPRPQQKQARPYEFHFEAVSGKKVSEQLSKYSESHKKTQLVKKTTNLQGLWYKENDNDVCILSEDDEKDEIDLEPPRPVKPSAVNVGIDEHLLKDQFNKENNFQLSSLIEFSNSLECPNLETDILNYFVLFQKARKVQDSLNKKYFAQGKRFDLQTIHGGMISLLLKSLKQLRKDYQQFPQQLPELAEITAYEISYMIHTSSYKNCKSQLLQYYKKKMFDPNLEYKELKPDQRRDKRIGDAYFLIELVNDTLGRMRFQMKRVGERRVQLMVGGKAELQMD